MPAWTLGDLMSMATARCGRRDDISASTVSFWVNEAYMEVAQAAPGPSAETFAKFSVISNTSLLALPADWLETISLSWDTQGAGGSQRTLAPASPEWCDARGYWPVASPPAHYFVQNNQIQLWPSSGSYSNTTSGYSFLLRYRKRFDDMTTTGSVPSLDTEWRKAILYLSEAFVHEYIGNEIEGANARARYAGYVSSLKDAAARRQSGGGDMKVSMPHRKSRY